LVVLPQEGAKGGYTQVENILSYLSNINAEASSYQVFKEKPYSPASKYLLINAVLNYYLCCFNK
jgi:hypothetical protein